ncbi:MAG: sugar ABC transporter permease [Acetobacteraceae bacterium]|nr:sugar ABC transporter permease [Acetobacteraceae bacterium]
MAPSAAGLSDLAERPVPAGEASRSRPGVFDRETLQAWLLILPGLMLVVAFTHWPAVRTLLDSLYATPRGSRPAPFVGLANYQGLLDDPVFWQALRNNAIYAAATIPASVVLALVMALAVNQALPGRAMLRMAYFLPTMLPLIAVANIWLFFYTPDYGLFDQIVGLFGAGRHNWLGDAATALPAMIIVAVWKEAGFFMIFSLAALQTMPTDLREAAALEGASRIHFFRRVTLPLLMPTTLFVLVNAVINAFRVIDHVVVMTRGGPDNATTLLMYYIYETGFRFWDTSTAAALTMILLALLGATAWLQFGVFGRRIHYR